MMKIAFSIEILLLKRLWPANFIFFKCEDCGNISSKMIRYKNKSLIYSFYKIH